MATSMTSSSPVALDEEFLVIKVVLTRTVLDGSIVGVMERNVDTIVRHPVRLHGRTTNIKERPHRNNF